MTIISKRQAAKLKIQGKLKPTEDTLVRQQNVKKTRDLNKAIVAIELVSKSVNKASISISKSVSQLVNKDFKVELKDIATPGKKITTFTVQRDVRGFIKTIIATESLNGN